MLSDKDNLNKALTDSCNDLKAKVESMKESAEQSERIYKELADLRIDYEKAVKEKADLERQIDNLKQHEAEVLLHMKEQSQLAIDKALLELEKEYQKQIQELKADKQAEIDKYQSKYFELLEQKKL